MADPGHVIVSSELWSRVAADYISARVRAMIESRGVCHLALAGGNTPAPVYRELDLDLTKVEFWFGDERCVPPDHADSNYRVAREIFGEAAVMHRMQAEREDRQAAADDYADQLPISMDITLLGMGGDGHTASIFPGQSPMGRVAVVQGPKPPPWRLTLTEGEIRDSREIIVLVTGASKAEMVRRALRDPSANLPIQMADEGTWILDEPAASLLKE